MCNSTCSLNRVPPVEITLTAKKEGYDATNEIFSISRGEKKTLVLKLRKTVILDEKNTENSDKIALIRLKKNISEDPANENIQILGIYNNVAYAYTREPSFSLFYYDENSNKKIVAELPMAFSQISWNEFDGIILLQKENGESGIIEIST